MTSRSNSADSAVIESSNRQVDFVNLSFNLQLWMTQLPAKLKALSIIQLAIPGSHNTMTYTIKRFNDIGPDIDTVIQDIGSYVGFVVKPIMFKWAVNQKESVIGQLNGGIRFLDLRVSMKSSDNQIYFLHGLYGAEVTRPLQEINDWLIQHPKEVIILDFQKFYNFEIDNHLNLIEKLNNIFARKICPVHKSFEDISLNWLNDQKYQVFIVYRNYVALHYDNLWSNQHWPTPWPQTMDPTKLVNHLNLGLQLYRSRTAGFVSQCLLTPDSSFIWRHPFGNLFSDVTPTCREAALPWIKAHSPGDGGMNVVITDDVAYNGFEFARTVIQRNIELL